MRQQRTARYGLYLTITSLLVISASMILFFSSIVSIGYHSVVEDDFIEEDQDFYSSEIDVPIGYQITVSVDHKPRGDVLFSMEIVDPDGMVVLDLDEEETPFATNLIPSRTGEYEIRVNTTGGYDLDDLDITISTIQEETVIFGIISLFSFPVGFTLLSIGMILSVIALVSRGKKSRDDQEGGFKSIFGSGGKTRPYDYASDRRWSEKEWDTGEKRNNEGDWYR